MFIILPSLIPCSAQKYRHLYHITIYAFHSLTNIPENKKDNRFAILYRSTETTLFNWGHSYRLEQTRGIEMEMFETVEGTNFLLIGVLIAMSIYFYNLARILEDARNLLRDM